MNAIPDFKNWRLVRSNWLEEGGRRLDCNPYMSGALEARDTLKLLSERKDKLEDVTTAIFDSGRESRNWVDEPKYGVPFMGTSAISLADLSTLPLISKKQVARNPRLLLQESWSLITRSGTIGRMAYVRPDMVGMACSEDVLRVVPDKSKIPPGYLYAFLSSKYGVPLVVSGTYGAIIQHIEPVHISNLPVPRFGADKEAEIAALVDLSAASRATAAREIEILKRKLAEKLGLEEEELLPFHQHRIGFEVAVSEIASSGRLEATYHDALVQEIERRIRLDDSRKISEVADVVKPGMFKRIKVDSSEWGYGFITGSELFSNSPKPLYFVSPKTPNIEDCVLDANWILIQAFGQIGGLIGRCMMTTPSLSRSAATDLQIQLRFSEPTDAGFVCTFLSSFAGYRLLARTPVGGSIPHINPDSINNLLIPWPEPNVRKEFGSKMLNVWALREQAVEFEDQARAKIEALIGGEN